MNEDQKTGAIILAVAVTLIAVTLILSWGWGSDLPGASLYLTYWSWPGEHSYDPWQSQYVETRYVLAPLVIVVGYGAIRYFSLIPPIFRRRAKTKDKED